MTIRDDALHLHRTHQGKLAVHSKVPVETKEDLSLAYSPGVAEPCIEIARNPSDAYLYTNKGNLVALVSNGTSVLGLGDIGPLAAIPVIEGKAILLKRFAGVDAFPLCLQETEPDRFIQAVQALEPSFGAIHLEDIAAPACFDIERRLQETLSIPVFHDDQHGTAIVTLAALTNALKVVGKSMSELKVVIVGAGASGLAIADLLRFAGVCRLILCDREGALYAGRPSGMNPYKELAASWSNPDRITGPLSDAIRGADVLIGVAAGGIVSREMVASMNADAIVLALANPHPEISPEDARSAGARIVGTGRSDYPNQVNNVLAFPGIFRGALDARATSITGAMKMAAASAIASLVPDTELREDHIIPSPFHPDVTQCVARAVRAAASAPVRGGTTSPFS